MVQIIKWYSKKRDWHPVSSNCAFSDFPFGEVRNYAFIGEKGSQELEIITTIICEGSKKQLKHTHDFIQEIYFVVEGAVKFNDVVLNPGDIIVFDPETNSRSSEEAHEVESVSKKSVMLTIKRVPGSKKIPLGDKRLV